MGPVDYLNPPETEHLVVILHDSRRTVTKGFDYRGDLPTLLYLTQEAESKDSVTWHTEVKGMTIHLKAERRIELLG